MSEEKRFAVVEAAAMHELGERALDAYAKVQELITYAKDGEDRRVDGLIAMGALAEQMWRLAEELRRFGQEADDDA